MSSSSRTALSDLLMRRLQQEKGNKGQLGETPAATAQLFVSRLLPMSFAQRRLWLLDRLDPGRPVYNMPWALTLDGPLDPPALARALNTLIRRHEVLRTTFETVNEEPHQRIHLPRKRPLPLVDTGGLPEQSAQAVERRLAECEARRPFDLETGPLLRVALLRRSATVATLLVNVHHIVFDGWSSEVFFRELAALYSDQPLPPLPLQYGDFATRQRAWLTAERERQMLDYWRGEIGPAPPPLELPTDRPRPAVASLCGITVEQPLSSELGAGLRRLCGAAASTPFFIGMSAFHLLLSRWAGVSRVRVGTVVANRQERDLHGLIGFFVNSVVVTGDVDGSRGQTLTFGELLRRLTIQSADLFAHQELPFERLVEELATDRDRSRSPLFQVAFVQQSAHTRFELAPGLVALPHEVRNSTAKWDLSLVLEEGPNGWRAECEFAADLFDATTMRRFLAQYNRLLVAAVTQPEAPISALSSISAAERQQIEVEWNDRTSAYLADGSLGEVLLAQVARTPDALALVFGDEALSYGELARRAGHIAACLAHRGVTLASPVALCFHRSAELVVSALGVVLSGGAYVPLDRDSPPERLAAVLADVGARIVLGDPGLELPAELVCLSAAEAEEQGLAVASRTAAPPAAGNAPLAPACVIYTSGSTGKPKGVAVTHRGVLRLTQGIDYLKLAAGARVGHASNVAFDAATFEVWATLLNGGCLVGIHRDEALAPAKLAHKVAEHRLQVLFLTTALFNQVAQNAPTTFGGLDYALFGGEAADPRSVARVLATTPPRRLLHLYGPTECTTFGTWYPVRQVEEAALTVPIGGPTANTSAFVLGLDGRPVPLGATGELFLGGDGVAIGYLGQAELTAQRFVPDPFAATASGGKPGSRLYKTGDLVRQRPSGALEFVGRRDHQVKLRGFRIELAEIEAALEALPEVERALALLRQDRPGEPQLAAYLKMSLEATFNAETLRRQLGRTLPRYAVPSAFVSVVEFPLTANGKIDRAALPVPNLEATIHYEAPRTEIERQIAGIWGEVLGTAKVGLNHSFWELGGQSLLATKVTARVQDAFGIDLPISTLFDAPKLSDFTMKVVTELLADGGGE